MEERQHLNLSVICPFKDKAKMTAQCIDSFFKYGPSVKEIILVSNNSEVGELRSVKSAVKKYPNVKVLEYNHPFNYQKINNWAVDRATGEYLLFLNNDTELVKESVGLLEKMHKKAALQDVGMVGCLLLYGDGRTIQHAGVFLRPGLQGDHLYVGQPLKKVLANPKSLQYPYDVLKARPLTAVTGAVQLIEKKKFLAVEGFDERFIICGGDVDLCIRLNERGYQTWYIGGHSYIIHKESQSRSFKPIPYDDFYYSYLSYMKGYDVKVGDPFLPEVTRGSYE